MADDVSARRHRDWRRQEFGVGSIQMSARRAVRELGGGPTLVVATRNSTSCSRNAGQRRGCTDEDGPDETNDFRDGDAGTFRPYDGGVEQNDRERECTPTPPHFFVFLPVFSFSCFLPERVPKAEAACMLED